MELTVEKVKQYTKVSQELLQELQDSHISRKYRSRFDGRLRIFIRWKKLFL